jgi:hypothetical protein
MKCSQFKFYIVPILIISFIQLSYAQKNSTLYEFELNSAIASENNLPFWLVSNRNGAIPNDNNIRLKSTLFSDFQKINSDFSFSYKASLTGYTATENDVFINELYGSVSYKKWVLTLGAKDDAVLFEGLSLSNGNLINSLNTRAFPGIELQTDGFVSPPFAKNWLSFKLNYTEYLLNDTRISDNTHVHHKSLFMKSKMSSTLNLTIGLDHFVQWGGTTEEFGKHPASFKDYLKIITGTAGGSNAYEGEQVNALGNHVGSYLVQLDHTGMNTHWSLYYSHPFEDRSGREFMNYPDGLFGFFIDFKNPKNWLTHLVTELINTKNQSGTGGVSGYDNYFNNKIYGSGWTYFGRTIGAPLFLTRPTVDGITPGIGESRFTAVHIGLKGYVSENIFYKSNITYTNYPGWFNTPNSEKNQFSTSFECSLPEKQLPFDISIGIAADFGNYSPSNIGGFISLSKKGIF